MSLYLSWFLFVSFYYAYGFDSLSVYFYVCVCLRIEIMLNHSIVDFIDIVGVGECFHSIWFFGYRICSTQTLIPKTTHLTNSVASYIVLICPFISNNSTLETMYWQNTINDLSAQKSMMTKWHAVQRTYWRVCVYSIYDVHKKNTQRLCIVYSILQRTDT